MNVHLRTLLVCSMLVSIPLSSFAAIFKYRDSDGRLTFVDDKSKVPAQYRDQVISLTEAEDSLFEYGSQIISNPSISPSSDTADIKKAKLLRTYQTPVEIQGNRVLVPVVVAIGNRKVTLSLLLDTGATTTVFHRKSLADLQLPGGKIYKARVAGGNIVKSEKIRFQQIVVGPFQQNKVYAMVINLNGRQLPFDGMLGMDFLKHHPYQIDFEKKIIKWEPIE